VTWRHHHHHNHHSDDDDNDDDDRLVAHPLAFVNSFSLGWSSDCFDLYATSSGLDSHLARASCIGVNRCTMDQ
jgi:hypothetical protein